MNLFNEIEKLFPEIEKHLEKEKMLEKFKNIPRYELHKYHFGLGIWIRSKLLYQNQDLMDMFKANYIYEPDEMSELMTGMFHNYLNTPRC